MKDSKCLNHIKNAKELGLNIGLYHYFRTNVSPIAQFNNFKSVYDKTQTNLIPMIDIEDHENNYSNINSVNRRLSELIDMYYSEYKTYPIIYLGSFNAVKTIPVIYKCPIWVSGMEYSNIIPNFSIKQIAIGKVGCNYIDLDYSGDVDKLKLIK